MSFSLRTFLILVSISFSFPSLNGFSIVQGDIAIKTLEINHGPKLWYLNTIIFSYDKFLPQSHRNAVQSAINVIQRRTCLRFKYRTLEHDYLRIFYGHGCWSFIGKQRGPQNLSLGQNCDRTRIAVHELMHALGIYHEHDRYDRDHYVKILWTNILPWHRYNFAIKNVHNSRRYTKKFDFLSVMLYAPNAFSINGKIVMEFRVLGQRILYDHEKPDISKGDVELLNLMYNCARIHG